MPATRLSARIVARLAEAEACELNPHYRDDLRIARLTVAYAASGEAVLCSPHVLASYMVLGLHPEKVWPAIEARRKALCGSLVWDAPVVSLPKKPVQSATLWPFEKNKSARAVNSRATFESSSGEPAISVPMAAPSIAALYTNSDAPSSAKKRGYTYKEWLRIVRHSYAPQPIRQLTLNALTTRGPWPESDGPAHGIICVSIEGLMIGDDEGAGPVVRSTAQRRLKRALRENYWRRVRDANSWSNCPKCGKNRDSGKCEGCGYQGRSKDAKDNWTGEFMRVPSHEIVLETFLAAPPPKGIRHFCARTWKEHKAAAKRGEHPNVTEMPRQSPDSTPRRAEPVRKTAEHQRSIGRALTPRQTQELARRIALYEEGCTKLRDVNGYVVQDLEPGHGRYVKPLPHEAAVLAACKSLARGDDSRDLEPLNCTMQRALEAVKEMEESP